MFVKKIVFQSEFDQNLPFSGADKSLFPWKNHWFYLNFYVYCTLWCTWADRWVDWQEWSAKVKWIKFASIHLISPSLFSEQSLESFWMPKETSYLKEIFEFECILIKCQKWRYLFGEIRYVLLLRNSRQLILPFVHWKWLNDFIQSS